MSRFSDQLMNHRLTVTCPGCQAENTVKLRQIKNEETITCRGCGEKIELVAEGDDLGQVGRSLDEFESALKKVRNLKI